MENSVHPMPSDIQLVFDNIDKPGATAIGPQAQQMADINE